jgi:hypothetical protein
LAPQSPEEQSPDPKIPHYHEQIAEDEESDVDVEGESPGAQFVQATRRELAAGIVWSTGGSRSGQVEEGDIGGNAFGDENNDE